MRSACLRAEKRGTNMPLDATAIACMAAELRTRLRDGRIDKIYQPEKDEIILAVRTPRENLRLLISAGHANPRIHITEVRKKNPAEAPLFCMLLRKHLSGGKIMEICQPDFERLIRITVSTYNELGDKTERILYAEFAGRNPNIILTDAKGKIIEAAHHTDLTAGRSILPGLPYAPPPLQDKTNPLSVDRETCIRLLSDMVLSTAPKALTTLFRGISPMAARSIAARATCNEDAMVGGNEEKIAESFAAFFDAVRREDFSPSLLLSPEGETVDFTAYVPYAAKGLLQIETEETFSRILERFYEKRDRSDRMRQKSATLKKRVTALLERAQKKIGIHLATLSDTETMEESRIYGELLYANLYRAETGMRQITLENFYADMAPVTIPLDCAKTPAQNAEAYFKKYRKMKTAAVVVREELKKAEAEAQYMASVLESIARAEDEAALMEIRQELSSGGYIKSETRGKKQKEAPAAPLEYEIEGFSVLVGRNNRQNDFVTLRLSRAEDIWLHTKEHPGSHVLIRTQHREAPDSVVRRAAELAAWHSSARESAQVPVDYTRAKHVWKPSGARPGMVLYEKQHTVYVVPKGPEEFSGETHGI